VVEKLVNVKAQLDHALMQLVQKGVFVEKKKILLAKDKYKKIINIIKN